MEKLYLSENRRYFVKEDGSPFHFLADTAWTVPERLKWDDAEYYMKTRKSQGFTVLQMVVLDPEFNPEMRDPAGRCALFCDDITKPNEEYFEYVDRILDMAESNGFYVLLLPAWGQLVTGDDWSGGTFRKIVNESNAYQYGEWLGSRYKTRNNILWCLGGDRMPVHKGTDYRPVWRKLAGGLAKGVLGEDLSYNAERLKWEKLLITYHACYEAGTGKCSTFSYWTTEEAWISFIMIQSGHGLYPKNYDLVAQEYSHHNMPVWDGEPAYEMMPTTWPVEDNDSFHKPFMVRKRAYWSLFAGAFGFTYGHASVWCCISEKDRNEISKYTWFEAIHSEGSKQMKVLRDFIEAVNPEKYVPCQEVLICQNQKPDLLELHEQACWSESDRRMMIYFPTEAMETINVSCFLKSSGDGCTVTHIRGIWFNPSTGECSMENEYSVEDGKITTHYFGSSEEYPDSVLILSLKNDHIKINSSEYAKPEKNNEIKKTFEW